MPLGEVLELVERPIRLEDDHKYTLVIAKRACGGIVSRGTRQGHEIRTRSQFLLRAGDFLISRRQIVHGACGIVPTELDGAIVSNEYRSLRPRSSLVIGFFELLAGTPYLRRTFYHSSVGVVVEKMVFRDHEWLRYPVHLPPPNEQQAIVNLICEWQEAVRLTAQLLELTSRRKAGLMKQLFAMPLDGGNGQRQITTLREIVDIRFSSVDKRVTPGQRHVRLCNYLDVLRHRRIHAGLSFTDGTATDAERGRFLLRRFDIALTKDSETAEDIALVSRVEEELENVVLGYHLALLRPDVSKVDPRFMYWELQSERVRRYLIRHAVGAVRSGLPFEVLRAAEVWLPPQDIQQRLADLLDDVEEEIGMLERALGALNRQRRAVAELLLTGKVRIPV
jgi:type I restriction enzyme S subunit